MTLATFVHDHAKEIGHWWQTRRDKLRDMATLNSMSNREIEELSGEIGLTRDQLEKLVLAGPHAADEMERMMVALDLDPSAVRAARPDGLRDLNVTCANCRDKRNCRHALADGTAAALLTTFCPNADELLALAARPELHSA